MTTVDLMTDLPSLQGQIGEQRVLLISIHERGEIQTSMYIQEFRAQTDFVEPM